MTANFQALVRDSNRKLRELRRCKPTSLRDRTKFPAKPGVYVISNRGRHLYAGMAKNLKRRFGQHINGKQLQSAFTLRVARTILGQKKIGGRYPKSLNKLLADDEFKMAVADAASKIANMKAQFVEAGSLRLRIVLEVQVGLVFKTKWNDFNLEEA